MSELKALPEPIIMTLLENYCPNQVIEERMGDLDDDRDA